MVTPHTLTLCLPYLHHYTPPVLAGRLPAAHLRRLAGWLGAPDSQQARSIRRQPLLATHLALLIGAGLISLDSTANLLPLPNLGYMHRSRSKVSPLLTCYLCQTAGKACCGNWVGSKRSLMTMRFTRSNYLPASK
jgi:hypothetical protein